MTNFNHIYIKVTELNEAINFYEKLFEKKISHREGDRWADFDHGNPVYFGILNVSVDGEDRVVGNNIMPALKTDDIEAEHVRIAALSPKSITPISIITQPAEYKYFEFVDAWGNTWEVAEYNY